MSGIRFFLPALLIFGICRTAASQGTVEVARVETRLPDSPGAVAAMQAQQSGVAGAGQIAGTVLDINGSAVAGAAVTLVQAGAPAASERRTVSDADGRFVFAGLPAARFTVTIASKGLETFVSAEIALKPGEVHELPRIDLPIAAANTNVQVTVTQAELAEEQIHAEEKQRVFGVLPNFYSSYIWDAAPLTGRQKFGLGVRSAIDPTEFLGAAVMAGAEYEAGTFAGYGYGWAGYGKRFAAGYGDGAITRMIGSAVLPAVLHQDPRYFYKGSGSKKSRALYAIERAIITRGDNGKPEPNYSHIGGAFLGGAISNAYHPAADRGIGLTLRNGLLDTAGNAVQNLIREFVLRDVTPSVPDYENGKP
jgi:hypothetical protein